MAFTIFNNTGKDVNVKVEREYGRIDYITVPSSKNAFTTNDAGLFEACKVLGLVPVKAPEPKPVVEKELPQVKKPEVNK